MLSMPGCCWLCRIPLTLQNHGICSFCYRSLPAIPPCCPRCGLPAANIRTECGRCLQNPPPWQALLSVSDYSLPLKHLVNRFKFSRTTALSAMLARLILLKWREQRCDRSLHRPDLILAIPLHQTRQCQRGFNQAGLLAEKLAHWCDCEYLPNGLQRKTAGKPQHQLSAHARKHNLHNIFSLNTQVDKRHIVVIDDVVTTGSTVESASRLLQTAEASSVQIWCLCRTL